MCIEAVAFDPWQLCDVLDHFCDTVMRCEAVVRQDPFLLQYVPDWFLKQQKERLWHDDDDFCNDAELFEWYDAYKKRKSQKSKTK